MSYLDKKISFYLNCLRNELRNCEEIYSKQDSGALKGYYTTFQKSGKAFDFGSF